MYGNSRHLGTRDGGGERSVAESLMVSSITSWVLKRSPSIRQYEPKDRFVITCESLDVDRCLYGVSPKAIPQFTKAFVGKGAGHYLYVAKIEGYWLRFVNLFH